MSWQSQLLDVHLVLTEEEWASENDSAYEALKQYGAALSDAFDHAVMLGIGTETPDNGLDLWVAAKPTRNASASLHKVSSALKGNPVPMVEHFARRLAVVGCLAVQCDRTRVVLLRLLARVGLADAKHSKNGIELMLEPVFDTRGETK